MKLFDTNSTLYRIFFILFKILLLSLCSLIGIVTIVGFTLSAMLSHRILLEISLKEFLVRLDGRIIFLSIVTTLVSIIIIFLASVNLILLDGMMRLAYLLVFALIWYCVLVINLLSEYLFTKKITFSKIMGLVLLSFPKYLVLFSIIVGIAYLILPTRLLYLALILFMGANLFCIHICIRYNLNMLFNKKNT